MQPSHGPAAVSSAFDDPNLVAYGGLEPVVRLAERCGLPVLANEYLRLPASKDGTGAFPGAKVMSLVGGMVAGADSIDDMDRLRHGCLARPFGGVRAPSTLGSFLRSFTHGHVKQLHALARRFLPPSGIITHRNRHVAEKTSVCGTHPRNDRTGVRLSLVPPGFEVLLGDLLSEQAFLGGDFRKRCHGFTVEGESCECR